MMTTPFPNLLIDEVMPTLKDTEWRLLCVVVRQTIGWQSNGQRKQRDWLTQSQLITRTGRNSQAVSWAIDHLVRQNLIVVEDSQGNALVTPAQRRRHRGRLYFRLGPHLVSASPGSANPKITLGSGKSPVGKSPTTKQTQTKYLSNDREIAGVSQIRLFLKTYQRLFQQHSPLAELPPIAWGRDSKIAKDLLGIYANERLVELLKQFFNSPDPWFKKRGYSLGAFKDALPALLMNSSQKCVLEPKSSRTASTRPPVFRQWTPASQIGNHRTTR